MAERIQKIIAQAGLCSRRAAERYLRDGRVRVNGQKVSLGDKADPKEDKIEIEGIGVLEAEPLVYIAMHKPAMVMTTADDPEKRATVMDILQQSRPVGSRAHEANLPRVYPVGRLDFDTEGLLLLTNDGELTQKLTHPKHHVPKTYTAKVKGRPAEKSLQKLRDGIFLGEPGGGGKRTKPAEVRVLKESPKNTWLEITVTEGRHHLIKRMCEAVQAYVIRLIRTEFGGIAIDDLEVGSWRYLRKDEVAALRNW